MSSEPGEQLVIRSRPGDEVFDAEHGPGAAGAAAALAGKLLGLLLSDDGRRIMRVIADRGPATAKVVVGAAGVERSKCYSLLADLRERGLIRDDGDGYELADRDVWAAVERGADVDRAG
ncbi:MAG: helix-turn-helix domain-containing protein [Gemmataceae bacterium]|nr:helix-turn-helix domain-containing protein [Gemmataceae bacterium]